MPNIGAVYILYERPQKNTKILSYESKTIMTV